jgi:hypothetical protein
MAFLKTLFEDFIDGFVSPELHSPFHTEKEGRMIAEMIIFNPARSGIIPVPPTTKIYGSHNMNFIYNKFGLKIRFGNPSTSFHFYMKSGGGVEDDTKLPSVEEINALFDDAIIQKYWNAGVEAGERWKKLADFGIEMNSSPTCEVNNWPVQL